MRKMTLEIILGEKARKDMENVFQYIKSYEVLETLKIDFDKGIYVDLIECITKEGISIGDLEVIGNMEILNVLGSEGSKHVCLVKGKESMDPGNSYKDLDLDLIWTKPSSISLERVTVSCIGSQESHLKFIDLVKKHIGKIDKMTFQKAVYQSQDLLNVLTEKQRDILISAHENGYYDYPRKINSEGLSKKVGIGRTTLVEHLRKAEARLVSEMLAGISRRETNQ